MDDIFVYFSYDCWRGVEIFGNGDILPGEQKGCRKGSCETKDQLLSDKTVLIDCKRRKTKPSMKWIDYQKAYDLVPQRLN